MACEIHSGDEMIATEMIFSGVLTDLDPAEAAGLLSALVFQVNLARPQTMNLAAEAV